MKGWIEDAMGEEFRFLHEQRMRLALGQARRAAEEGEVPVGAVIYDAAGQLVGKAWNQTRTLKDPTAHAEVLAITQAAAAAGDWRLEGHVLYVTKEPCPMCAGAIVLARIPLVVWGVSDPLRGGGGVEIQDFADAGAESSGGGVAGGAGGGVRGGVEGVLPATPDREQRKVKSEKMRRIKMRMHPITKRRWARFRGMRRAWWAFWVLVVGYGVSLFSEWIANDRPLFVRMGGKCYWPVVKFYPEDAFNGSGRMTRPDWRALEASGVFEGAVVVWPPLRWGPLESVPAGSIELPKVKTVVAVPEEHAAYAEIDGEGRIVRVGGEAERFGLMRGGVVDEGALPEGVREGLAARRADRAAGAVEGSVGEGRTVALSPYEPRGVAPSRVRVTWREAPVAGGTLKAVVEDVDEPVWPEGFPKPGTPGWTHRESREEVRFPMRPVKGHPLGLDSSGRDVAARMLYALRTSLSFGLLLVVATMGIGTLAGAVQGYCAGAVDLVGQRVIEIWESLPFLYVLILLGSVYGQGFGLLLGVYALFNWVGISHYMRAEFLRLRKQPFVEAAQGLGLSGPKIVFRHILPNALVPLVTFFPFQLVGAIGSMAALDYLGFGLPPPSPSWGELLAQAQEFPWAWWLALYPALALFAVMLAGVFVGEGLRAAWDPRPVSRWE